MPDRSPRTVLLVEDDPHVRLLVERLLTGDGYAVLSAGNAAEALALVDDHGAELDLLLTDVMLGEVHGGDVARRALEVAPDLRVVYTSGLSRSGAHRAGMPPGDGFLSKPFRAEDLAQVLDAALAEPR
jgi:CheY-like chemotaxis protein